MATMMVRSGKEKAMSAMSMANSRESKVKLASFRKYVWFLCQFSSV